MSWVKTCAWLAVFICVSTPVEPVDPKCISDFLKDFKPPASQLGIRFSEVQILFPDIDLESLTPFDELDFFNDAMLARHHIIPRSLLLEFFVRALAEQRYRPRFVSFLRNAVTEVRQRNRRAVINYPSEVFDNLESITPEALNGFKKPVREMFKVFCWMPFNIFIGPNGLYRSDDPGASMETGSQVVVDNQETYDRMVELNNVMVFFSQNRGDRDGNYNRAMDLLELLFSQRKNPYDFESELWIETAGEYRKYHLRNPNEPSSSGQKHLRRRGGESHLSEYWSDPFCAETESMVEELFANTHLWLDPENDAVYNLSAMNLVSTKRIIDSVVTVEPRHEFSSWRDWYGHLPQAVRYADMCPYFSPSNALQFRDGSFAILVESNYPRRYTKSETWLVTDDWEIRQTVPNECPFRSPIGIMVFDKLGRPMAIRMQKTEDVRSLHYYQPHGRWVHGFADRLLEYIPDATDRENNAFYRNVPQFRLFSRKPELIASSEDQSTAAKVGNTIAALLLGGIAWFVSNL